LLYGSETWKLSKSQSDRLDGFVRKLLRRSLGWKWSDKRSTDQLMSEIPGNMRWLANISRVVLARQARWLCLAKDKPLPYRWVLDPVMDGTRRAGGPMSTFGRAWREIAKANNADNAGLLSNAQYKSIIEMILNGQPL